MNMKYEIKRFANCDHMWPYISKSGEHYDAIAPKQKTAVPSKSDTVIMLSSGKLENKDNFLIYKTWGFGSFMNITNYVQMHKANRTAPTGEHNDTIVPQIMSFSGNDGIDVPVAVDDKFIVEYVHNPQGFLDFLNVFIVRRAGLLWSQQDFEWRWSVPLFKCLTVLEFYFILFDLCLLITFFNFIMNYVPIVTFWIFTYHKIWILSIMFCFIWSYWIIYFLACLEVSWRVVS